MSARILSSQPHPDARPPSAAPPPPELVIGGITPFTTIDFPGRLAAVLYTQGCAWRCRYCHNSHLWPFHSDSVIPFHHVVHFLERRKGLLDGVVFSGGEPTAHKGLLAAMHAVKGMGFQVGLHTTGMHPDRLREALRACDWVGMDVKAPFHAYQKITQIDRSGTTPLESVGVILEAGIEYEFRTTVHPLLLSEQELLDIARTLSGRGARRFVLQAFHPDGCPDPELKNSPVFPELISNESKKELATLFESFQIRK